MSALPIIKATAQQEYDPETLKVGDTLIGVFAFSGEIIGFRKETFTPFRLSTMKQSPAIEASPSVTLVVSEWKELDRPNEIVIRLKAKPTSEWRELPQLTAETKAFKWQYDNILMPDLFITHAEGTSLLSDWQGPTILYGTGTADALKSILDQMGVFEPEFVPCFIGESLTTAQMICRYSCPQGGYHVAILNSNYDKNELHLELISGMLFRRTDFKSGTLCNGGVRVTYLPPKQIAHDLIPIWEEKASSVNFRLSNMVGFSSSRISCTLSDTSTSTYRTGTDYVFQARIDNVCKTKILQIEFSSEDGSVLANAYVDMSVVGVGEHVVQVLMMNPNAGKPAFMMLTVSLLPFSTALGPGSPVGRSTPSSPPPAPPRPARRAVPSLIAAAVPGIGPGLSPVAAPRSPVAAPRSTPVPSPRPDASSTDPPRRPTATAPSTEPFVGPSPVPAPRPDASSTDPSLGPTATEAVAPGPASEQTPAAAAAPGTGPGLSPIPGPPPSPTSSATGATAVGSQVSSPVNQRPERFAKLRKGCLERITEFQASAELFLARYDNVVTKVINFRINTQAEIYEKISMRLTNDPAKTSLKELISNLKGYSERLNTYADENLRAESDIQKLYVVVQCVNALRYEFDEPLQLVATTFKELYRIVEEGTFEDKTFMLPYNMILRKSIKDDIVEGKEKKRRADRAEASEFQNVTTVLTNYEPPPDQETLPNEFKTIQGWYNNPDRFDKRRSRLASTTRKNNIEVVNNLALAWSVLDLLSKEQRFFEDKIQRRSDEIKLQPSAFGAVRTAYQTTMGDPLRGQWERFGNGKDWIPWILGHGAGWYADASNAPGDVIANFQYFHLRGLIARWFFAFADADRVRLVDHYILLLEHMMKSRNSIDSIMQPVRFVENLTRSKLLGDFEKDPPFTNFDLSTFDRKKDTYWAGFVDEV